MNNEITDRDGEAQVLQKVKKQLNSIYGRIWQSIALVVVIVFALGGTAVTIYVNKSLTSKIEEQEYAYLANADTILDHQISSTQQMINTLLTNPFVIQSIYTGNRDWNSGVYQSG